MPPIKKIPQGKLQQSAEPLTIDGIIFLNISEAATHFGLQEKTVMARLRYGWTVEDALKKPVRRW